MVSLFQGAGLEGVHCKLILCFLLCCDHFREDLNDVIESFSFNDKY